MGRLTVLKTQCLPHTYIGKTKHGVVSAYFTLEPGESIDRGFVSNDDSELVVGMYFVSFIFTVPLYTLVR